MNLKLIDKVYLILEEGDLFEFIKESNDTFIVDCKRLKN